MKHVLSGHPWEMANPPLNKVVLKYSNVICKKNEVDCGGPKQIYQPNQQHSYDDYMFYVVFDGPLKSQGMISFSYPSHHNNAL